MKILNMDELKAVNGGGLMRDIGYEIGSGLAGEWGKELGNWLYEVTH
ncbi:bacteriocin [Thalassotalea sediminis]|nr:bacteriocin [Thalassotalea sediminis]